MDDAVRVGVLERGAHLAGDAHDWRRWEASAPIVQRSAFDQLHHDVGRALDLSDVVDGDDVGMVELGGGLRLVHQPRPPGVPRPGSLSTLTATSRLSFSSRAR